MDMTEKLSDRDLIEGMLNNSNDIIQYFFFEKCTPVLHYVTNRICDGKQEKNELINDLYLYLQKNDWYKLRQFDYRSKLTTWLSVVSIRFFQKKRAGLIDCEPLETLNISEKENPEKRLHQKLDVDSLINRLPNERYRFVIRELMLNDREPQEVAVEMKITVENLYNIKRRASQQLAKIAGMEVMDENISDELLAAFPDGNTTREETELVLEAMAFDGGLISAMDLGNNTIDYMKTYGQEKNYALDPFDENIYNTSEQ
jgi:RNA polymerase sigma factor (sigma-70 family)